MKRPWKDFAAFMVDTYGVMAYIDDPDEDADDYFYSKESIVRWRYLDSLLKEK